MTIISFMAPRFVSNCIRAATSVAVARCPWPCTVCRQPTQGSTILKAFTAAVFVHAIASQDWCVLGDMTEEGKAKGHDDS